MIFSRLVGHLYLLSMNSNGTLHSFSLLRTLLKTFHKKSDCSFFFVGFLCLRPLSSGIDPLTFIEACWSLWSWPHHQRPGLLRSLSTPFSRWLSSLVSGVDGRLGDVSYSVLFRNYPSLPCRHGNRSRRTSTVPFTPNGTPLVPPVWCHPVRTPLFPPLVLSSPSPLSCVFLYDHYRTTTRC